MEFDMMKTKWHIDMNGMTSEERIAIYSLLVGKYGVENVPTVTPRTFFYTNWREYGVGWENRVYYGADISKTEEVKSSKEIRIDFKKVAVSVSPIETEQEKKIRELEKTIEKAQQQIQELKGM